MFEAWRRDQPFGRPDEFERFIKGVRVEVNHLPKKQTRVDGAVPRMKTIFGLANPQRDGRGGQGKAPRISKRGGSAQDVSFFLEPAARAGVNNVGKDGYVKVSDFFASSKCVFTKLWLFH